MEYEATLSPGTHFEKYRQWGLLTYLLLFNALMILIVGRNVVSVIAYPYSFSFFRRGLARTTNHKIALDFKRCISRLVEIIEQLTEGTNDLAISNILTGNDKVEKDDLSNETIGSDEEYSIVVLNTKEIYMKIAMYIELINLYIGVNEQIILSQR